MADGQFSGVLRFESLGEAPVAAAMLINGMAVQLALLHIERALDKIRERVDVLVEASKIEVEADLAAAMSVLRRIERRVNNRGVVDVDDWTSLAAIEFPIKAAYHQTVRWLDPLRNLLDDERSLFRNVARRGRTSACEHHEFEASTMRSLRISRPSRRTRVDWMRLG